MKNKIFRSYFVANTLAYIGINMGLIGINWYLIDVTESNQVLSTYSAITILSTIVFSLFIGILVDKYNKSVLMKMSSLIQALLIFIIFVFFINQERFSVMIYLMAIINSFGLALFGTASRSILQNIIIDKKYLIHGNSIIEICMQLGAIVAACVTGILYENLGFKIIIYIMIISLVLSSIALKYTKKQDILHTTGNEKVKLALLLNDKRIILIGFVAFIPYIVTLLSNNVLPGYVNIFLKAPSTVYGIADTLYGIGAVISGFFVSFITKFKLKNTEMKLFSLSVFSLFLLYISKSIPLLFVLYFVFGLSNTSLKVFLNTLFMKAVPEEIYGKCYSVMNSAVSVFQVLMLLIIGKVLDFYGASLGYLILALMMLTCGILYKLFCINK